MTESKAPEAGWDKKTILIVEDDQQIRELLAQQLEAENFNVLQAENGPRGLDTASDHKPDLILLDIHMPEMSGFQMLKKLREKDEWGAHVPVIYLTDVEMSSDEEAIAIEETQPAYYLVKNNTDLSDIVSKIRERLA